MNHLLWMLICASLCILVESSEHNIQTPTYHDHHQDQDHDRAAFVSPTCHGADCYEMMEPKSRRRILADAGYISYGALTRDSRPCSLLGYSYYNCRSQQANPYNRGCTKITNCARNSHWFLALVGGNITSHCSILI